MGYHRVNTLEEQVAEAEVEAEARLGVALVADDAGDEGGKGNDTAAGAGHVAITLIRTILFILLLLATCLLSLLLLQVAVRLHSLPHSSQPPPPLVARELPLSPSVVVDVDSASRTTSAELWRTAHERLLLHSQLRLLAYMQTYEATTSWPVWVEPGDQYLRLWLHPAKVWALMAAVQPTSDSAVVNGGSGGGAGSALLGEVQLTITLQPVGVSRIQSIDMRPGGDMQAAWLKYLAWMNQTAEERARQSSFKDRAWSILHERVAVRFYGLNSTYSTSPLTFIFSATNGSHQTFSAFHPLQTSASFQQPAPLVWPNFPLSYSPSCHYAHPASPLSLFAYSNVSLSFRHFPSHPRLTSHLHTTRNRTGRNVGAAQSKEDDPFPFYSHWTAFSDHYRRWYGLSAIGVDEDSGGCQLTDGVLLSSPLTRMLQERTAAIHFADLLYLADHAIPPPPASSSGVSGSGGGQSGWSESELIASLPPRRLLPAERAMLPSHCSEQWWSWYASYAASHLHRAQLCRSSTVSNHWPQTDVQLLQRLLASKDDPLLPLKFVQFKHPDTGMSDVLKGVISTALESMLANRLFSFYPNSDVLRVLSTSLELDPDLVAPALLVPKDRDGEDEAGRQQRLRWPKHEGLGFDNTEGYWHDDRVVEEYEARRARQLVYREGGFFGLSSTIANSTLYKPLFDSLAVNDSNVFGCVAHSLYQVRLFTLLHFHLDSSLMVVRQAMSQPVQPSEFGEMLALSSHVLLEHPWSFRLSLLSALLRPDHHAIGLQIRDGDANFGAKVADKAVEWETQAAGQLLLAAHPDAVECATHRLAAHAGNGSALVRPFVYFVSDKLNMRKSAVALYGSKAQRDLLPKYDFHTNATHPPPTTPPSTPAPDLLSNVTQPPPTASSVTSPSESRWAALFTELYDSCRPSRRPYSCIEAAYSTSGLVEHSPAWLDSALDDSREQVGPLWISPLLADISRDNHAGDDRTLRLALVEQLAFSQAAEHIIDHTSGFGRVAGWSSLNLQPVYGVLRGVDAQCWRSGPYTRATTVRGGYTEISTDYYRQDSVKTR